MDDVPTERSYRFANPLGINNRISAVFMALSADTASALTRSNLKRSPYIRRYPFHYRVSALRLRSSALTGKFLRTCHEGRSV
jgi:hypothetical protein